MIKLPPHPTSPRRAHRYPLLRLVRANLYDLRRLLRESRVALVGFGLLTLAGTAYLRVFYGRGYAEGLYETLKLLTLQSGLDLPADLLGQFLFFLIPLLGLALVLDSVFRFGRLVLDKGSRREAWQVALASTYQRHIIVCGLGRVGLRVATQLRNAGYELVVVERDWNGEFVPRALDLRVPVVLGDARDISTLDQARLRQAHAMVICIDDDLVNIEIALTARAVRPTLRVVLRVFNEDLDRNLERTFGANSAFSASALAAPTFAAAAVSREVDYVLPLGGDALGITQIVVQPESQMSGFVRMIEETHGIRVLDHVSAEGRTLGPELMRQLNSGDVVTLIGSLGALESLRLKNIRGSKLGFLSPLPLQHPSAQFNRVIVCGLGKVGYRVVNQLHRLNPRPAIVVVYDSQTSPEFLRRVERLGGVSTVRGDARNEDVLRQAGIDEAYSVAAITSNDLINLQIGLAARRYRPDVHLVLRVFSDVLADKLADIFGIRTAFSTSALAGPTLAAAAVLGGVSSAFWANNRLYSVEHVAVRDGDALCGRSVDAIRAERDSLVISLRRDGHATTLPDLDAVLAPGDEATLLAPLEAIARLRAESAPATPPGRRDAPADAT